MIQCWGARQGEGQRIGRVKYLYTSKNLESETLYPSRTSFIRDTARVGSSVHGWERIKGVKTLTQHFYYHMGGVRTHYVQSTFRKSTARLHTRPPMHMGRGADVSITQFHTTNRQGREFT